MISHFSELQFFSPTVPELRIRRTVLRVFLPVLVRPEFLYFHLFGSSLVSRPNPKSKMAVVINQRTSVRLKAKRAKRDTLDDDSQLDFSSKRLRFEENDKPTMDSPGKKAALDMSALRKGLDKMDCDDDGGESKSLYDSIISSDASRQGTPSPEKKTADSDESGLHDMDDKACLMSPLKRRDAVMESASSCTGGRAVKPRRRYTYGAVPETPLKEKRFLSRIHGTAKH